VMGLMVALISLGVAALGLLRWLNVDLALWYQGKEIALGAAVIVMLGLSFAAGQLLSGRAVRR